MFESTYGYDETNAFIKKEFWKIAEISKMLKKWKIDFWDLPDEVKMAICCLDTKTIWLLWTLEFPEVSFAHLRLTGKLIFGTLKNGNFSIPYTYPSNF